MGCTYTPGTTTSTAYKPKVVLVATSCSPESVSTQTCPPLRLSRLVGPASKNGAQGAIMNCTPWEEARTPRVTTKPLKLDSTCVQRRSASTRLFLPCPRPGKPGSA